MAYVKPTKGIISENNKPLKCLKGTRTQTCGLERTRKKYINLDMSISEEMCC